MACTFAGSALEKSRLRLVLKNTIKIKDEVIRKQGGNKEMSLNDPLSNVLSQINAYEKAGKKELITNNTSKTIKKVLSIMQDHKYLGGFEEIKDAKGDLLRIHLIGRINKTSVIKPRFSVKKNAFEKFEKRFLPAKDFGILIISTPQGMMPHTEAKKKGIGGRLISYCY